MTKYILAIDQGTTSSRAIIFDKNLNIISSDQKEFNQHFPNSGWVEHDPEDIWQTTLETCHNAISRALISSSDLLSIGITNQRETIILWDRETGTPVYRAIVWQDRRTANICQKLKSQNLEVKVKEKTGLLLDPYFSATKISWILENVSGARLAATQGKLAFGTVDTFLLWRLTKGAVHATDITNASRTSLFNIHKKAWDDELLSLFDIPKALLPEVRDCTELFGMSNPEILGSKIPITGIAGDQQAAAIGQACFSPGMVKSTYGTGCFALLNTGANAVSSSNKMLTTIAYGIKGHVSYALEGSIFIAGAAVQWLRDGIRIIDDAKQTSELAERSDKQQDIYLVPAFTGLGAPYWDPDCRGAIFGITRDTGREELARAALEAVCYQTRDLLEAMKRDWTVGSEIKTTLRVDGGLAANNWAMQFLADILMSNVDRPVNLETTALGAAYLSGLHMEALPPPEEFETTWARERCFKPAMSPAECDRKYKGWSDAVQRTLINNVTTFDRNH